MNTQETREAMSIEIDAQPTTNPLDVETALPSAIVRNWPDAMWTSDHCKRIAPTGAVMFCAIGVLAETGGFDWGEPDTYPVSGARIWYGFSYSGAAQFVAANHALSDDQIIELYQANDLHGKDAAADLLASWGI